MYWWAGLVAVALPAARAVGIFVIPPDSSLPVPQDSLSYAYGETMEARWLTDWQTVTLTVENCDGEDQHILFTNVSNQNSYAFLLDASLPARCTDYALRLVPVLDEHGVPPTKSYAINSQLFRLLNVSNPQNPVGTILETIVTGVSAFKTITVATTITAPFTPLWQYVTTDETATAVATKSTYSSSSYPTTSTSSSKPTASSLSPNSNASSGLSGTAKIGLGVGLGLGLLVILAAATTFCLSRRRRERQPSRDMTGFHGGGKNEPNNATVSGSNQPGDEWEPGTAVGGLTYTLESPSALESESLTVMREVPKAP